MIGKDGNLMKPSSCRGVKWMDGWTDRQMDEQILYQNRTVRTAV